MDLCHQSLFTQQTSHLITLDKMGKHFNSILSYLPCLKAPLTLFFMSLSVAFTLTEGHMVSREQSLLASFSGMLFN